MKRETRKPKKIRRMIATTLALICTLAGVNIANADTTIKGTLDRIYPKSEGIISLINDTYTLTEITDPSSVPANAVTMTIGNTSYYYIPETTETYKLVDFQNLANTGNVALIGPKGSEYEDTINLKLGSNYYSYTTAKLPTSAYTLTEDTGATPQATSIKIGDKYYSIDLKTPTDKSGTGHVTYSLTNPGSATGSVEVKLPVDKTQTIYYTYSNTNPTYGTASVRVTNMAAGDVYQKLFQGMSYAGNGGAIYNQADKSGISIISDFINNSASSKGGAIYNYAYIDDGYKGAIGSITGDFIGNCAESTSDDAYGGAIMTAGDGTGTIGNITGDFIGNYAKSTNSLAIGGAIENGGTITNLNANFIGNYADAKTRAVGGAIDNCKIITSITGDFIGNYAKADDEYAYGGAINNGNTISSITGDFIGNYADGKTTAQGGAINNRGTMTSITGDFIGNYAQGTTAQGGAIYNKASRTINSITGDFIGNYAQGSTDAYGGVIVNAGTIASITGDFTGNYAQGSTTALGGAIRNERTINSITGDFIGNYAQGSTYTCGGALNNTGTVTVINSVTGDFIGNYAEATSGTAYGGAISNEGTITSITGDFTGNYAQGSTGSYGGAIWNLGTINFNGTNTFSGNYTTTDGTTKVANDIHNEGTINILGGTTTINGGITDNATTPSGIMTIGGTNDGTLILGSDATLKQNSVTVASTGKLVATNAGGLKSAVTNYGTIELQGGTLASAITGGTVNLTTDALTIGTGGSINDAATIAMDQAVTVADGTLTLNSGDSWNKALTLSSGNLTLQGRTGTYADTTTADKTYNQTGGTLTLNNSSLNLDTSASKINGDAAIVNINSGSKLEFGNAVANKARVVTDTNTSNELTLSESNTSLELTSGSSIDSATKTTINSGTTLTIDSGATVNLNGDGTADSWKGTIANKGTLNLDNMTKDADAIFTQEDSTGSTTVTGTDFNLNNASDKITAGTLTIGDGTGSVTDNVLTVSNGTITTGTDNAKLVLNSDATLEITGGTVTLDGGDTWFAYPSSNTSTVDWAGNVTLNGGSLTLKNIVDTTRTSPTHSANKTGVLTATTGNLTIDSSTVLLGAGDTIADAVHLTMNENTNLIIGKTGTETASAYIGTDDSWSGTVYLYDGGTLTLDGVTTQEGTNSLYAVAGTLNLVNTGTETGKHGSDTGIKLGSNSDTIAQDVKVTINSDLEINNTNATGVILNDINGSTAAKDTWISGTIKLANGNLTINNTGTQASSFVTDTTHKYVQTGGTLNLNESHLTLNAGSKITGGEVVIDPSSLVLNNGEANSAKITMKVDDSSSLTIKGKDADNVTSLTLLNDSDIDYGTVTVGDGNYANVLNISNNSNIASAVTFVLNDKAIANIDGDGAELNLNTDDIWKGKINLSNAGATLNYDKLTENGTLVATAGSLNIGTVTGDGILTLGDESRIDKAVNTVIAQGATLNITTGKVTLNGVGDGSLTADDWSGNIYLTNNGSLTLTDALSKTTTDVSTYNQDGGTLNIDNATLSLATPASAITNGIVSLTNKGTIEFKNKGVENSAQIIASDGKANVITVGDSDAAVLNLLDASYIDNAAKVTVTAPSVLNISNAANVYLNTNDSWDGKIVLNNGNASLYYNDLTSNGILNASNGNLNIGTLSAEENKGTLEIATNSYVNKEVVTQLASGATLNITGGDVTLNGAGTTTSPLTADTWAGKIAMSNGSLTLSDGLTHQTSNGAYTQTGGTLNLDGSTLDINTADSEITNSANPSIVNVTNASNLIIENDAGLYHNNAKVIANDGSANTITIGKADGSGSGGSGLIFMNSSDIKDETLFNIHGLGYIGIQGDDTKVTLNENDTLDANGNIYLTGGSLIYKNRTDSVSLLDATKAHYVQDGGNLIMENSTMNLDDATAIVNINDSGILLDKDSTMNIGSRHFEVKDLASAGLINSINGETTNDHILAGDLAVINSSVTDPRGAALGYDSQADFMIDLYARTNSNQDSDTYTIAGQITSTDGTAPAIVNISDWNLTGDIYGYDAPIERSYDYKIFDAAQGYAANVAFDATNKEVRTPIGWYGLHSKGEGLYSLDLNRYNPEVFRGQVATVAQWENQLSIADMLFTHSMILPSFKEDLGDSKGTTGMYGNRYAATDPMYAPYQYSRKDGGVWCKMYGNFETLQMSNVGKVGNNAYGALIGADFGLKELSHGWKFMPTAYIGYNGAHQYYSGLGMYQNGGQAGFMGTWYKDNVILSGLAYGGVYDNSMDIAGHNENTFNYFAGASAKAAYNWRFHRDWVLQPNLMVAYNFFGQQNWHSNYGQMGMMASALHGVNIAPGLNLIWEKDTFSTYFTIQYMYNINGAAGGQAGNVSLPQVYMDRGYIQYGIGFTKKFSDRFSGYLQAVIRNVGRNGGAFQAGFTWTLGKGPSNIDKELKSSTAQAKETKIDITAKK